jgi:hypothetical protein
LAFGLTALTVLYADTPVTDEPFNRAVTADLRAESCD